MNLELSANYALNVILVKRLGLSQDCSPYSSPPGLCLEPSQDKIRLCPGEELSPRERGSLDLAGAHFQSEVFTKNVTALRLPDAPGTCRQGLLAFQWSSHTFILEGDFDGILGSHGCCLCVGKGP